MPERRHFKREQFVLCEGEEDAAFVRALLQGRNAHRDFDVSPNKDVGNVGGSSGFERAFLAVEPVAGFNRVKHVVVVADNDDDPSGSFQGIIGKLDGLLASGDIKRGWPTVGRAGLVVPGDPSLSVWMWPAPGEVGCLETLLWRVIEQSHPEEAQCALQACECSGANCWPTSKYHKALVRCFISLKCRKNPAVSLSNLWRDFDDLIPVGHDVFRPFSDFLASVYS